MYDDYDFNQEDDFQKLIEGKLSDDEEFFKEDKKRPKGKQSTQLDKSTRSTKSKTSKRKQDLFIDDDSNSVDLRSNDLDGYDEYEKRDKYDDYDQYEDDYGDNDPVNPFDEAEEEPVKKAKAKEGDEQADQEKPKRKNVVRNPRIILNEEKLKSSDGVIKLPELFKEFKFKGKNHEKEDLNRIMSVYQGWAHRLMPSLQFDDFIEKAENLCRKGKMKVFNNKIRTGMSLDIRDNFDNNEQDVDVVNQYDSADDGLNDDNLDLMLQTMGDDEILLNDQLNKNELDNNNLDDKSNENNSDKKVDESKKDELIVEKENESEKLEDFFGSKDEIQATSKVDKQKADNNDEEMEVSSDKQDNERNEQKLEDFFGSKMDEKASNERNEQKLEDFFGSKMDEKASNERNEQKLEDFFGSKKSDTAANEKDNRIDSSEQAKDEEKMDIEDKQNDKELSDNHVNVDELPENNQQDQSKEESTNKQDPSS